MYGIRWYVSGRHWTPSQFALQKVVGSFGNLLAEFEEAHLTHTYQVVFHFCQLKKIDYMVLRYLNTGALPFEEWAEEWLHKGDV
jgi:hypothetical protein